jgi:hypothetical protein
MTRKTVVTALKTWWAANRYDKKSCSAPRSKYDPLTSGVIKTLKIVYGGIT